MHFWPLQLGVPLHASEGGGAAAKCLARQPGESLPLAADGLPAWLCGLSISKHLPMYMQQNGGNDDGVRIIHYILCSKKSVRLAW